MVFWPHTDYLTGNCANIRMDTEVRTGIVSYLLCSLYMWQSCPADGHTTIVSPHFLKMESSVLTGYSFFVIVVGFPVWLPHLDLTHNPTRHPEAHLSDVNLWDFTTVRTTVENVQNYRNILQNSWPGGIHCTDASLHTHIQTQRDVLHHTWRTHTCSLPLCMQCRTYKAQRSGNFT